jgi:hypothetical protein
MKKCLLATLLIIVINPVFAQSFLTNGQVYDFNVGDIIQGMHHGSIPFSAGPPTYETRTIIGEELVTSLDTIHYTVKREFYTPPSCPTCSPTFSHDTIIQTVTNLSLPANHYNQTTCLALRDSLYLDTCGRQVWEKSPIFVDTCFEPVSHTTFVIEGVGGDFFTMSDLQGPQYTEFTLLYYSKFPVTCGTRVTELIKIQAPFFNIQISPNPASETITITLESELNGQLYGSLLDACGKEMKQFILSGTKTQIAISDLTPGIYFVKVGDWVEKLVVE